MKQDKQISFRLSQETLDALQALANKDSRSLASYIRLTLEQHVSAKAKKRAE